MKSAAASLGLLVALLVVVHSPSLTATQNQPLATFVVYAQGGEAVRSSALGPEGGLPWILVYVEPHGGASESLLRNLKKELKGPATQRWVLVVGGLRALGLDGLAKTYPDLRGASWYADPRRDAYAELGLEGVPVVLGLRKQEIAWRLSGAVLDGASLQSLIATWLRE